ncbi:hydroxymethylglutaryl-CoA lyase, mitochondrial-like [Panonychus citri]|uniref:hydroxymethylglutaryl-CoA lyase, mitochondrial-like n=1 Tax=Panonychus citri TaxID=50023 RepID=UPI0023071FAB|nr:hydroxymethylglutaryl-CoA lyase, mitochondrial-like [Panonychus citri]XP_053212050.1 hydroxymethylglutaryl-CoA lyase, mitochondrial-like [Panonychus citri]
MKIVNSEVRRYPSFVKIVEVSPRDGLQNEKQPIPTHIKTEFINKLSETGVKVVEVTSFVSPKWVPQMADHMQVYSNIRKCESVDYTVLVPNMHGLENALKLGVKEIAVFGAASDLFSKKNTNCTLVQNLTRMEQVAKYAIKKGLKVRGYISCCLGCPYEGPIPPERVAEMAYRLYSVGCYEISLGDTIGVGNPSSMRALIETVSALIPLEAIAVHCHDTYGQALANILSAIECGVTTVDASVAGLGGCPFAKGATGNVATEDVIYMLTGMGIETGVDMDGLLQASEFICAALGRETSSKVGKALLAKRKEVDYDI